MVREFLEITNPDTFLRITENATFVIRIDPYLFAQYFGFMFFIDLSKISNEQVGNLLRTLKNKSIIAKRIIKADSLSDFLNKMKK
ncbi:MAG: hypothetical protein ACP6IS_05855 [Candidatus Asgardarchaeia archaeon]